MITYVNCDGCLKCHRVYSGKHYRICDKCINEGWIENPIYQYMPSTFFKQVLFLLKHPVVVKTSKLDFQI